MKYIIEIKIFVDKIFVILIIMDLHIINIQKVKKHLENIRRNEMIIPEWLFQEPIENKKINNPKSVKHLAREQVKANDKKIAKKY